MMQNSIKYKVILIIIILNSQLSIINWVNAQESVGTYRYSDATQLWRQSDNAAGLGIDTTRNRGYAQIGYEHHSGDYTRVQEGQRTNQLRFLTERYQKIGKYLYGYGCFNFDYGRVNDRSWSDVRHTYNSNPYIPGSDIKGKYDFQDFNFTAALASVKIKNHWNFGLKLDYMTGDLSRLRDPRPRNLILEYKITPAVTYSFGKNTIGLSGNYHRRKEKITGVKVANEGDTKTYYDMTGLEHVTSMISGFEGYKRQWVDHRFGGELTYGYNENDNGNGHYQLLVAAKIERGAEDLMGQHERQYAKYIDYKYGLNVMNRLQRGRILHEVDVRIGYDQGYSDEYRQKEIKENVKIAPDRIVTETYRLDDGTLETKERVISGQTISQTYYETQLIMKKRYQVNVFDLDIHYRMNFLNPSQLGGAGVGSYIGLRFAMQDVRNKYLLPTSTLRYNSFDTTLEGGLSVLKGRLWFDGALTYRGVGKAELNLDDPTTPYAVNVLIPDMTYYGEKFVKGSLAVTYNFPIRIKGKTTSWYVKANGDWLKTNTHRHAASAAITLGIYN
ncbi:MAG: hypothetical protein IKO28_04905 [Prevotella sp.]|nr:hypothetical protein [Prevotella sp.]